MQKFVVEREKELHLKPKFQCKTAREREGFGICPWGCLKANDNAHLISELDQSYVSRWRAISRQMQLLRFHNTSSKKNMHYQPLANGL